MTSVSVATALCPRCRTNTVVKVFTAPFCTNCGASWVEYRAWRDELHKFGLKPGKGNEVLPDYITSGELESEVNSAIELATLEARFMIMKDLGSKAADIVSSGLEEGIEDRAVVNSLLQLIVDELRATMRAVGRGGDE